MKSENERLKAMLYQATNRYNGLHTHVLALNAQQQKHSTGDGFSRDQGCKDDGGSCSVGTAQFMDLGMDTSASLPFLSKEQGQGDEERCGNKVPRMSCNGGADDQATQVAFRRARVSVRSRCEAAMVSIKGEALTKI